ncbi:MAG: GDP-L-fucose synthase [Methanococcoides sp.]|nr:GDP-L-fucose synthase [Methanococcoides sp.]
MNKDYWSGKKVLVTGGAGFLGKHLVPKITELGADVFVPRSKDFDLRKENDVDTLFKEYMPDIVIHMAVHGGGIGYMKKHPGSIFYDNIMMNSLVVEKSRQYEVEKFTGIGTVCSYPKYTPVPFREEDLWNGYPEETNAPYGLAKKMLMVQTQAYREEYGFNGIHLLMVNMYGPHDDFNLESSHVIPALIRKFTDAVNTGKNEVDVWGTGEASREFLYVEDAAEGIILATEKFNEPYPVNIGVGSEIKIKDLVELIAGRCDYQGDIIWDTSKPDGQPTRCLNVDKAKDAFGFEAGTDFREGLIRTIEWYRKEYQINEGNI